MNVLRVARLLVSEGYTASLVGGCVRDMIRGVTPKDFDLASSAKPDEMIKMFESNGLRAVYENNFGMVKVVFKDEEIDSYLKEVEVTTYREDGFYSDGRHPENVTFCKTIQEDVARRDFTVNAMAINIGVNVAESLKLLEIDNYEGKDIISENLERLNVEGYELVDLFGGVDDLRSGVVRSVGDPDTRFLEDALRLMRGVRFACQLGFIIEEKTFDSIRRNYKLLESVSVERIREEFFKIVKSRGAREGLVFLKDTNLIDFVVPELKEGVGCEQSRNHVYDVWNHNINALDSAAKNDYPVHIRLAALFHDIGKPRSRRFDKKQNIYTFYGHEVIGARMVKEISKRLKFPKVLADSVYKLVRYHMFFSDTDIISHSAVRRMIANVGRDLIWDLMKVRRCDRKGMGRPKADPYRLRMYESMIEEVLRDPVSVKQLKIDGDYMIAKMDFEPGRRMGWVLHALLEEVIDDPSKNSLEYLESRSRELNELNDDELKFLGEKGKRRRESEDHIEIKKLRRKHKV